MTVSNLTKVIAEDETALFMFRQCIEADHIISGIPFDNCFKDPHLEERYHKWQDKMWERAKLNSSKENSIVW